MPEDENGSFEIYVENIDGNFIIIRVNAEYTIHQIKEAIERRTDIPVANQRLIYKGTPMEDSKTVSTYNVPREGGCTARTLSITVLHVSAHVADHNPRRTNSDTIPLGHLERTMSTKQAMSRAQDVLHLVESRTPSTHTTGRMPCPPSRYYHTINGSGKAYFVLVGGEGPYVDPMKRGMEHTSLTMVGQAYAKLRRHFPRSQIIVIAQLAQHLAWLREGPFRYDFMKEAAPHHIATIEEACQLLLEEGGAHYDGEDVHAATVWSVLIGQYQTSPQPRNWYRTWNVEEAMVGPRMANDEDDEGEGEGEDEGDVQGCPPPAVTSLLETVVGMGFERGLVEYVYHTHGHPHMEPTRCNSRRILLATF